MASCDLDDIEDYRPIDDDYLANFNESEKYNSNFACGPESKTESIIPGTQNIWVKTWGCAHNMSDGEYMAGQLSSYGYTIVDNKHDADVWVLNSCTVKSPSEDHFRNEISAGRKLGKYVVLAGCVPQAQPRTKYMQGLSMLGVQQIDRIVEVVEETLKGNTVRLMGTKKINGRKAGGSSLQLPKIRKNPLIEIIPISTGCLNQCTYCKTRHARGQLGSYPPEDIVARASQALSEGVVEIWLSSEDTGAYGLDIGTTLPELLEKLVVVIPEGAMLRVGMTNPPYMMDYLEHMAVLLQHPRIYSFLHVPVQSGSTSVLSDMKREYSSDDFTYLVDFLKARVPDLNVATDVICGFPTETEKDFEETVDLVERYQFASLFINQFYPRPGTVAAKMPRLPPNEVKQRTKRITDLFYSFRPYEHKVNSRQTVLVTELSHDGQYYVGHNKSYDQVLVPIEEGLLGRMVTVDIVSCSRHSMMGRIVRSNRLSPANAIKLFYFGTQKFFAKNIRSWPWLKMSVAFVSAVMLYRLGTLLPNV